LKTVCFDKTGTLTEGKPKVTDMKGFAASDEEALRLIAALENGSNHPIATAVLTYAASKNITPPTAQDVKVIPGKGLSGDFEGRILLLLSPRAAADEGALPEAARNLIDTVETEGKTAAILMENGTALGLFAVRDEPRDDAREGLRELSRLGIKSIMLTGDNRRTGSAVAAGLGIEARAELLPEDKAEIVKQLENSGQGPVGKVGDGINDAPALAAASVGIAMGGGTDIALETADAALLMNSVMGVADLVKLSRATLTNIRMNIILALGSKAIFLVTTILGFTGMWIAVMADTGATVLVTLNALRLLRFRA
jgi:Cd2+/Zn2+-exporting ATPase